jgi:hypothetical protein
MRNEFSPNSGDAATDFEDLALTWCGVKLKDWYRDALKNLDRSELKVPDD